MTIAFGLDALELPPDHPPWERYLLKELSAPAEKPGLCSQSDIEAWRGGIMLAFKSSKA